MNTTDLNLATKAFLETNPWIYLLIIWIIVWKALALWQAARREEKIWFIAIMIINTFGILEIIYLAYNYFMDKKLVEGQN